jgi:hypothetical protein
MPGREARGSIPRLNPDGCLVRHPRAIDTTINEDADAGKTANRVRDETPWPDLGKKMQEGM